MTDAAVDETRGDIAGIGATVPALLRSRAESLRSKALLASHRSRITYGQADERSAALARGLLALGVVKGQHIALIFPNDAEFVVAAFAVTRIGAVAAPMSTMSTPFELEGMLRDADINMVLSTTGYRSHDFVSDLTSIVPGVATPAPSLMTSSLPCLRHVFFTGEEVPEPRRLDTVIALGERVSEAVLRAREESVTPADRQVIIHTSGSTSSPKAVLHTHGGMLRHMASFNRIRRYDETEVLFSNSPFFWVGGWASNLMATLVAGATLVCSGARDPGVTLDLLERERPTLVNGFPQSVVSLAEHDSFADRDLSSIRRGNLYPIMPPETVPADPALRHNLLGSTEAGTICLVSEDESDQPEHRRGSYGRVAPGFEGRVVNSLSGELCDVGEIGELQLRGPFLMEGYYGRERHETFDADGWFRTGDQVHCDADGFHYFHGRQVPMIKTAGANVSPREVEDAIRDLTGLWSVVWGVDDEERGQVVTAVVTTSGDQTVTEAELKALLATRLSIFKVPRTIRVVSHERVPVMMSGKIDMRALKALAT